MKELAQSTLIKEKKTCVVVCEGQIVFSSDKRGVTPLVEFINAFSPGPEYILADKVIGKAAALLCVKAGIFYIYANIISSSAKTVLQKHKITFDFETEVPSISNRTKTGLCPMEVLSHNVTSPEVMYTKVISWLANK